VRQWLVAMIIAAVLSMAVAANAETPTATIGSADLSAELYLPDVKNGFYRGTRFDWSGIVRNLRYKNLSFFGPWFDRQDPSVHDFVYSDNKIVAGTCSATMGPVEEFQAIGYDQAQPNGTFLKIGVGVLRRPDAAPYDQYRTYEVVDSGTWTVEKGRDWIRFTQKLVNENGYGYVYTKTIRLIAGQPRMVLEHSLKNIGSVPLETSVYDHNFLVMNRKGPQKGTTLSFPFAVDGGSPMPPEMAEISGKQIVYRKTLEGKETVSAQVKGFSRDAADYSLSVESPGTGAGVKIHGDRPLSRMFLWSIRSVLSIEPFIDISIKPQQEMTWAIMYDFYTVGQ